MLLPVDIFMDRERNMPRQSRNRLYQDKVDEKECSMN
jgi:hypothetical protein